MCVCVCVCVCVNLSLFYCHQHHDIYYDKTQHANSRGNPLYQETKQHLNNSYKVKNEMQDTRLLLAELFCDVVFVSSQQSNITKPFVCEFLLLNVHGGERAY